MPAVVLRNPKLSGQPIVIDVPVGDYIPDMYRDSGYEIDRDTTPADAANEIAETAVKAQAKAGKKAVDFVAEFAPEDDNSAPAQKSKPAAPASGSQYANTPPADVAEASKEN